MAKELGEVLKMYAEVYTTVAGAGGGTTTAGGGTSGPTQAINFRELLQFLRAAVDLLRKDQPPSASRPRTLASSQPGPR